jgi:hypothetical protein
MGPEGGDYWSNSIECEPAMARLNSTSAQVGVFDESGVETKKAFGTGEQLCMCYGVEHTTGRYLDICLLVGTAGEIRVRHGVAIGIQSPELNGSKMLPQCKHISIAPVVTTSQPTTTHSTTTLSSGSVATSSGSLKRLHLVSIYTS